MKNTVTKKIDVVIVGAGVLGLWLLNRLRQLKLNAVLLETETIGGGQSHKAQGIIHGGMKYALHGVLTDAAQTISDMPTCWRSCLEGTGLLDLSSVSILSPNQFLWSPNPLTGKLSGFFAGLALSSHVESLDKAHFPDVFQYPQFKGQVYTLDEIVIDVNQLLHTLAEPHRDAIFKIETLRNEDIVWGENNKIESIIIHHPNTEPLNLSAQHYIFSAGAGNAFIIDQLKNEVLAMQRRPLHMVVVKPHFSHSLYAHCLGWKTVPRMTITTHRAKDGEIIWYLGGQIAEEGIIRNTQEQIAAAQKELQSLFSWLDFSRAEWASFMVDRAEPFHPSGKRPDSFFAKTTGNMTVAWPTKLALAPKLAEELIQSISILPNEEKNNLPAWPSPEIAKPIWDTLL